MNRFEVIERIFDEHGFTIDGKEFWQEVEQDVSEKGNERIEFDDIILDGISYRVFVNVAIEYTHFDEDDNEVDEDEEYDYTATDISLRSIEVSRKDGGTDEHTFIWDNSSNKDMTPEEAEEFIEELMEYDSRQLGIFISLLSHRYIQEMGITKEQFMTSLGNSIDKLQEDEK